MTGGQEVGSSNLPSPTRKLLVGAGATLSHLCRQISAVTDWSQTRDGPTDGASKRHTSRRPRLYVGGWHCHSSRRAHTHHSPALDGCGTATPDAPRAAPRVRLCCVVGPGARRGRGCAAGQHSTGRAGALRARDPSGRRRRRAACRRPLPEPEGGWSARRGDLNPRSPLHRRALYQLSYAPGDNAQSDRALLLVTLQSNDPDVTASSASARRAPTTSSSGRPGRGRRRRL